MERFPKKKNLTYSKTTTVRLKPDVRADIDLANAHGYDTAEISRLALQETFRKLRIEIESKLNEAEAS